VKTRLLLIHRYLKEHIAIRAVCILTFALIVGMVVFPLIRLMPVISESTFIPLHYNIYLGIDRFGPWGNYLILPILALVFALVNLFVASSIDAGRLRGEVLEASRDFLSLVLAASLAANALVLSAATVFFVLLNI